MTTIIKNTEFEVITFDNKTFFVNDITGQCWKRYKNQNAAVAYFNKISEMSNAK